MLRLCVQKAAQATENAQQVQAANQQAQAAELARLRSDSVKAPAPAPAPALAPAPAPALARVQSDTGDTYDPSHCSAHPSQRFASVRQTCFYERIEC
jgi:hypothetical protein